ncbi:hypothetical protein DFH09DRAFT_1095911 [Mycena vulgaris]|nr:hypothetical protein DFH09DRAFT_1095911 [Mycena vulgaris]
MPRNPPAHSFMPVAASWVSYTLDEDEDEALDETVIIRSFDSRHLTVEELVNLQAPALVARLTPASAAKLTAGTSTARSTPEAPQSSKWTAVINFRGCGPKNYRKLQALFKIRGPP